MPIISICHRAKRAHIPYRIAEESVRRKRFDHPPSQSAMALPVF